MKWSSDLSEFEQVKLNLTRLSQRRGMLSLTWNMMSSSVINHP